MKENERYTIADGPDVDLEKDDVRDSKGNRITQDYVDRAADNVHKNQKRRGRPSLTGGTKHSPAISFRAPQDLVRKAERRAAKEGKTVSELAREALEKHLSRKAAG